MSVEWMVVYEVAVKVVKMGGVLAEGWAEQSVAKMVDLSDVCSVDLTVLKKEMLLAVARAEWMEEK